LQNDKRRFIHENAVKLVHIFSNLKIDIIFGNAACLVIGFYDCQLGLRIAATKATFIGGRGILFITVISLDKA
jgi:hypothetical protein